MRRAFRQCRRSAGDGSRRADRVHVSGPGGRLSRACGRSGGAPRGGGASSRTRIRFTAGTLHNKVVFRAARALTRRRASGRCVSISAASASRRAGTTAGAARPRTSGRRSTRRSGEAVFPSWPEVSPSARPSPQADRRRRAGRAPWASAFRWRPSRAGTCPDPACPALFVVGEHDAFGPPGICAEFVGRLGADRRDPGSRSLLRRESSTCSSEAIADFLAGLPVAGRGRECPTEPAPRLSIEARRDLLDLARGHARGALPRGAAAAPRVGPRGDVRRAARALRDAAPRAASCEAASARSRRTAS